MEKTTKKKKSKGLKRRIGIIAIGGLSLVLTICLSVGATLAWFAGSTSASNTMYMGGPVYVEMAGRGQAAGTAGSGDVTTDGAAKWVGGSGSLDIHAAARDTGTVTTTGPVTDYSQILLPGQKLMIYSQARVFSTNETTTVNDGWVSSQSSGANTTNTQNGTAEYKSMRGRVTTTTTSVLRAKFSINVEFDPTVGINNFTTAEFAAGYPVQSAKYFDEANPKSGQTPVATADWFGALGANPMATTVTPGGPGHEGEGTFSYTGRRDAVKDTTEGHENFDFIDGATAGNPQTYTTANLTAIKAGTKKSIYEWKYVSADEYNATGAKAIDSKWKMAAPFDGSVNSAGGHSNTSGEADGVGNGFYGVWVPSDGNLQAATGEYKESAAFYKARTSAYLLSYRENYVDEYQRNLVMGYRASLTKLEEALNESFKDLVNWSSDAILQGAQDAGFNVNTSGVVTNHGSGDALAASWLYVDPNTTGAQDTNASDSATSMGGWWYLVATDGTDLVSTGANKVLRVDDKIDVPAAGVSQATHTVEDKSTASPASGHVTSFQRAGKTQTTAGAYVNTAAGTGVFANNDTEILYSKLFEISPTNALAGEVLSYAGGNTGVLKTVSIAFPFVNGSFELPGKELTNNFANAKITFQISFQALQAFFPYTRSIDGFAANHALLGTAKALNIKNAVPIFNEAFDYLAYLNV